MFLCLFCWILDTVMVTVCVYVVKAAMQGFTQKIVQMMKDDKLFASQGGPIILSQVYKLTKVVKMYVVDRIWFKRIDLENVDWEWVWPWVKSAWTGWSLIRQLGCENGSWFRHWSPMGDVQGRWCTWPNCETNGSNPFFFLWFNDKTMFWIFCDSCFVDKRLQRILLRLFYSQQTV